MAEWIKPKSRRRNVIPANSRSWNSSNTVMPAAAKSAPAKANTQAQKPNTKNVNPAPPEKKAQQPIQEEIDFDDLFGETLSNMGILTDDSISEVELHKQMDELSKKLDESMSSGSSNDEESMSEDKQKHEESFLPESPSKEKTEPVVEQSMKRNKPRLWVRSWRPSQLQETKSESMKLQNTPMKTII